VHLVRGRTAGRSSAIVVADVDAALTKVNTSLRVFGRPCDRGGRGKNVRRGAGVGQPVYLAGWSTVEIGLQEVAV
jgi:hypothetical protein